MNVSLVKVSNVSFNKLRTCNVVKLHHVLAIFSFLSNCDVVYINGNKIRIVTRVIFDIAQIYNNENFIFLLKILNT